MVGAELPGGHMLPGWHSFVVGNAEPLRQKKPPGQSPVGADKPAVRQYMPASQSRVVLMPSSGQYEPNEHGCGSALAAGQ